MKVAVLIARILLGLIFLVFGLNFFLHFLPMQTPPGLAGQYMGVLFESHYALFIGAFQVIGGALLLSGLYVPLGLTILGPLIVNILLFHILMAPSGILPGLVTTLLWFVVFSGYRKAFAGILGPRIAT